MLATGALLGLRTAYPTASLELVAHREAGELLRVCGIVGLATSFDATEVMSLFLNPPVVPARWRNAQLVVLWMRETEALAAAFRQAGARLVVPAPDRPSEADCHVADYLTETLRDVGVGPPGSPPELRLPVPYAPRSESAGIVVHPGSGSPRKNWAAANFARLIEALSERGFPVAICAGPADDGAVAELLGELKWSPPAMVRPSGVRELAAVLAAARLYIGNDSGVSHLAALLGTPTIAVFGGSEPAQWSPRGRSVRVLGTADAWPSVEDVLAEAQHLLANRATGGAAADQEGRSATVGAGPFRARGSRRGVRPTGGS